VQSYVLLFFPIPPAFYAVETQDLSWTILVKNVRFPLSPSPLSWSHGTHGTMVFTHSRPSGRNHRSKRKFTL